LGEGRVRLAVVQRYVRWWAQHDEGAGRVASPLLEHTFVSLEVGEVVLLLEPRVLEQLGRARAVARQPFRRDRVGDHDPRGCPTAQLMLEPGELVVERRCAGDAQTTS